MLQHVSLDWLEWTFTSTFTRSLFRESGNIEKHSKTKMNRWLGATINYGGECKICATYGDELKVGTGRFNAIYPNGAVCGGMKFPQVQQWLKFTHNINCAGDLYTAHIDRFKLTLINRIGPYILQWNIGQNKRLPF